MNNISDYITLLTSITLSGRKFISFEDTIEADSVILRHDVDYSAKKAAQLASVEASIGVKSTYFFMVNNPLYNLCTASSMECIEQILCDGHRVGLHADLSHAHESKWINEVEKQRNILSSVIQTPIESTISIHRPSKSILGNYSVLGISTIHTYTPALFSNITYISDSRGKLLNEIKSQIDSSPNGIQLLIHPIWWVNDGIGAVDTIKHRIDSVLEANTIESREWARVHCSPYATQGD